MKSAEDWMQLQEPKSLEPARLLVVNRQIIREIQLDAMKEGARRAAKHLLDTTPPSTCMENIMAQVTMRKCSNAILSTAEQWTAKDL